MHNSEQLLPQMPQPTYRLTTKKEETRIMCFDSFFVCVSG